MATTPPRFTLPPPKNKKQAGQQAAYRNYVNAHPGLKQYANGIYRWAVYYGVDPVYFASLINTESHGAGHGPDSNKGAIGIGQVMPLHIGEQTPWNPGHRITEQDLRNPAFNLRWSAWYFGTKLKAAGYNYDQSYRGPHGYNQGGPKIFQDVPKGYVPTGTASSPQQAAERAVETGTAKQNLTDPYVTIKNGRLVKTDQRHAIKVFGQPLRRSQFLDTFQNLNDIYLAYTGKPVTARAVRDILVSGKSRYQIIDILSKGPNFVNSPVWKQNAPGYEAVWKNIYGEDSAPDPKALRYAIVNNLGGEGFAQTLRDRPDYETSREFKTNEAGLSSVYTKIYGVPDGQGALVVKTATRQGQSPDIFASWLRAQPEYQASGEFKSRALALASTLGFVTGQTPTLGSDLVSGGHVGTASPTDPNAKPAGVL